MWLRKLTDIQLIFFASVLIGFALGFSCMDSCMQNGIFAEASGNAVYIEGEACTINMTETQDDLSELDQLYMFCAEKHAEYLLSLEQ